ncbi:methionine adenosyltransferase [Candidatus Saccharibacteria bacterium]|jgi:S-adenosylmethionine synthetase|nr:methionine adenosyltransferase [Candidatus Saccharibacteria bacterium]
MNYQLFTSESVCAGHPDKIADQISDAILDAALAQDPQARVAIETAVKDRVMIFGELTTSADIDYEKIVRSEVKRLGYTNPDWGFTDKSPIEVHVNQQSPQIAEGVGEVGAGDQGMMFGYACDHTENYMPLPITLAHEITKKIDKARESGKIDWLRPDGKAQVTVGYDNTDRPVSIEKVVVAVSHSQDAKQKQIDQQILDQIVNPALALHKFGPIDGSKLTVNGTGAWYIPGPASDAGLTGRKIVVDSYGGYARVGGGAFSGKDPSKVDRSGAYAARYLAKNIVAAGLAEQCEVALAYCIGQPKPVMQAYETFGTAKKSLKEIEEFANNLLDTSVVGIINHFDLRRPIYKKTASYGHFGRSNFPWEKTK